VITSPRSKYGIVQMNSTVEISVVKQEDDMLHSNITICQFCQGLD
jgi:hypothetical protein